MIGQAPKWVTIEITCSIWENCRGKAITMGTVWRRHWSVDKYSIQNSKIDVLESVSSTLKICFAILKYYLIFLWKNSSLKLSQIESTPKFNINFSMVRELKATLRRNFGVSRLGSVDIPGGNIGNFPKKRKNLWTMMLFQKHLFLATNLPIILKDSIILLNNHKHIITL